MSDSTRELGLRVLAVAAATELVLAGAGASPWLAVLGAAVADAGAALMLLAGRREARGQLGAARALARRAGFALLAGTVGWTAAGPGLGAGGLALLAGGGAILSGLSGKPRPSGTFAALLYIAARTTDLVH